MSAQINNAAVVQQIDRPARQTGAPHEYGKVFLRSG
jgi:hypothetical protein